MKINTQKIRKKKNLYISLFFLNTGILLKIFTNSPLSVYFLLFAAFFKLLLVREYIKKGIYKPGYELIFLSVGLFLFLFGLYAYSLPSFISSRWWLMIPGLVLKFAFLFVFISKIRKGNKFINNKK